MNLYYTVSTYHLLNAILYSIDDNDDKYIVVSNWLIEKLNNITLLKKYFNKVIIVDANYRISHSKEETKEYFIRKIGEFNKFQKIYVWGAHLSFGICLSENNINYIFCEDGSGLLSRAEIIKNIDKKDKIKARNFNFVNELGLYDGINSLIMSRFCNLKAQIDDFVKDDTIIDFNVIDKLYNLPDAQRKEILEFFNVNKNVLITKDSTLLLTQHYANLYTLTFEEQVLIYQLLVDYFFYNENLVIKPHPDDIMYYHKLFPEAEIIREKFPSEFMPFIFDNQPKCVATISSTAIFNLHGVYPQIFELDTKFEKDFKMIHRYYFALNIAKKINKKIVGVGVNKKLVEQLCKLLKIEQNQFNFSDAIDKTPNVIFIVDEANLITVENNIVVEALKNLDKESDVIFINSQDDYCWYDYYHKYLWVHIKPFVLSKKLYGQKQEDFYSDLNEEVIYVYSKNKEVMKVIDELEIEKKLPHTGIVVNKTSLTPEQEHIKILEGVLAATERRLLYYIEKDKKENN